MLSDRLHRILHLLTFYGQECGTFNVSYDLTNLSFYVSSDPGVTRKLKWAYCGTILWLILAVKISYSFYHSNDIDNYNTTLFFWSGGVTFSAAFSILRWFPHDVCRTCNMAVELYRNIHGNEIFEIFQDLYSILVVSYYTELVLFTPFYASKC